MGLKEIKNIGYANKPRSNKCFLPRVLNCLTLSKRKTADKGSKTGTIGTRYLEVAKNKITDEA